MKQVPLQLKKDHLSFENYYDPNAIICQPIQSWLGCPEYFHLHIEGVAKSGKSHLLHAAINITPLDQSVIYVNQHTQNFSLNAFLECDVLIIDDTPLVLQNIDRSSFVHLYNHRLNQKKIMLTASGEEVVHLPDDITSRMHSAIKLQTPTFHSDESFKALLSLIGERYGYQLTPQVLSKMTGQFSRQSAVQINLIEHYIHFLQTNKKRPSNHSFSDFLKQGEY